MKDKGQLSIIAALLVAVILVAAVSVTYSIIRNSPIQDQPPIQNAIDETNFAIKQIVGFTVGYYGSVLQVTGNSTYANMSAIDYFQSGLANIANMHPEWATSLDMSSSALSTYWFTNTSYSQGDFAVSYNLTGLGITGINYTTSCRLSASVIGTASNQAILKVTQDDGEPLINLGKQNFNFYLYYMTNSSWKLANPSNEPTAYANGTYQIDIPPGVDPHSYTVQIEDQRGIIVVASSFNSYSCTLTWGNVSANGILNQALYAHNETATVGSTPYYLQKLTSDDGAGNSLSASMSTVGRQLWGKLVYPLTEVSSIPASTWTIYYRTWKEAPPSIAPDASSSFTQSTSQNFISWSHTTGSGSNRLLVVTINIYNSGGVPATCSGCTYNGVAMTQQVTNVYTALNPEVRSYIYNLTNPPSGTYTVRANFSTSTFSVGAGVTYSGVDQTNPIQTSSSAVGSGTSQSVLVNVVGDGRAVYGSLASYRTSSSYAIADAGGQNHRWGQTGQSYKGDGDDKLNVSPGGISIGWTTSATARYVCLAVAINPVTVLPATGHCQVDILVRKSDGIVRTTIATNVAASGDLTSTPTTLSGTFPWAAYSVVNQTDYLEIDYYINVTAAGSGTNSYLRIDEAALAIADQTRAANVMLPCQNAVEAVVELLQNGTMRWLGQGLSLTTQAKPIPPIPVKSFHVNETLNGLDSEVPFQIEDWASEYRIPLGLTNNASIFNSGTMLVFLLNPNVTKVTLWWNGSGTATQTPLAYTNRYFTDDSSSGILRNNMMTLQFYTAGNSFTLTSTVGSASCTANFMRINNQNSTYGAGPAYVIANGVVRDIVHQEAEWSSGVSNCPDIYSDIVLTLPANSPYYTYQLRLMFAQSQRARNVTDLCPIAIANLNGQSQTENGTASGYPIVSNITDLFYNYSSSTWAHHWSQTISGAKGAGIMFTDSANQELYVFDGCTGNKTGALKTNSTTGTIELLPVTISQVNINPPFYPGATDIIWYGAVATFDGTTSIYDNYDQTGLWTLVEYPPSIAVTTGS